ncbi:hypothetical protein D3C71_1313510 [compost metagenome]
MNTGDDGFYMDFASWVIAQGEELFDNINKEGSNTILSYINKYNISEGDYTFECMLYVFEKVKEMKTKGTIMELKNPKVIPDLYSFSSQVEG